MRINLSLARLKLGHKVSYLSLARTETPRGHESHGMASR